METIHILPEAVSEELLQAIINHGRLKKISFNENGELPTNLDAQLLVEAVTGVEGLWMPRLPTHLTNKLLTDVSEGRSNLKRLRLFDTNLAEVPPPLVASALTRLKDVSLGRTRLNSDQVETLMDAISQAGSSIRRLNLFYSLPREEDRTGPLNLKPLVKVEKVELRYNFFTQEEMVDFFEAISPSTELRELMIQNVEHWAKEEEMDGSTQVMAKAINFLEEVFMEARPYQVNIPEFFQYYFFEPVPIS